MLSDKVKDQIMTDYITPYFKSVSTCTDYKTLGRLTRSLIQSLITVAFPVEKLALLPFIDSQSSQKSDDDLPESQDITALTIKEVKKFELEHNTELSKKESLLSTMIVEKDAL